MRKVIVTLILCCGMLVKPLMATTPAISNTTWPEGVTPKDSYVVIHQLHDQVDALLAKKKIKFEKPALPAIDPKISSQVVFQLHLSIIQLLHHYQVQQGLRPIPVVVSSPIEYYPVDVKYLSQMILQQLKKMTAAAKIKVVSSKQKLESDIKPTNVYESTLIFYLKLLQLAEKKSITADELYDEFYRINHDVRNIIKNELPQIKGTLQRRIVATSLYGTSPYVSGSAIALDDVANIDQIYVETLNLRKRLVPLLSKKKIPLIAIPEVDDAYKATPLDVFVQAQIINATLGQWKDVIDVNTSSSVTVQSSNKTYESVYQSLLETSFIVGKYADVSL